ncbi:MAG: hypothetical protein GY859_28410, partial [Desulfobacterales bacterium]|nr:hypothetical protein [Desulfobacterales bacterium]
MDMKKLTGALLGVILVFGLWWVVSSGIHDDAPFVEPREDAGAGVGAGVGAGEKGNGPEKTPSTAIPVEKARKEADKEAAAPPPTPAVEGGAEETVADSKSIETAGAPIQKMQDLDAAPGQEKKKPGEAPSSTIPEGVDRRDAGEKAREPMASAGAPRVEEPAEMAKKKEAPGAPPPEKKGRVKAGASSLSDENSFHDSENAGPAPVAPLLATKAKEPNAIEKKIAPNIPLLNQEKSPAAAPIEKRRDDVEKTASPAPGEKATSISLASTVGDKAEAPDASVDREQAAKSSTREDVGVDAPADLEKKDFDTAASTVPGKKEPAGEEKITEAPPVSAIPEKSGEPDADIKRADADKASTREDPGVVAPPDQEKKDFNTAASTIPGKKEPAGDEKVTPPPPASAVSEKAEEPGAGIERAEADKTSTREDPGVVAPPDQEKKDFSTVASTVPGTKEPAGDEKITPAPPVSAVSEKPEETDADIERADAARASTRKAPG